MIPLGKAVGIKLFADGALVVSLEGSDTLKVGDLLLKVNDTRVQSTEQLQALLQKTGGILQGMSGSPLVQNGMLVGAVTHVFVDEPDRGYAIFAETVRNAEKNLDQTTRNAA